MITDKQLLTGALCALAFSFLSLGGYGISELIHNQKNPQEEGIFFQQTDPIHFHRDDFETLLRTEGNKKIGSSVEKRSG